MGTASVLLPVLRFRVGSDRAVQWPIKVGWAEITRFAV
jgi:hypothetical protein